jgi:hypothetical protein
VGAVTDQQTHPRWRDHNRRHIHQGVTMSRLEGTILDAQFPARREYPNIRYQINTDGTSTLVRSNSIRTGRASDIRPHHVEAVKKAFKRIRRELKNPRDLKHVNRCYSRILRGDVDIGDVVQILGDFQTHIRPYRPHVERETKTEANNAA